MRTAFKAIGFSSLWALTLFGAAMVLQNAALARDSSAGIVLASNDAVANIAATAGSVESGAAPSAAPATSAAAPGAIPSAVLPPPAIFTPSAAPAPSAVPPPSPVAVEAPPAGNTIEAEETGATNSVNAIVHRLGKESENITLNDLNSARQAITKIETLIELEKKLTELEKVQKERESKSAAAAIPASMLMPPQSPTQAQDMTKFAPPPSILTSDLDIDRIIGGGGVYRAIIKTPDGSIKTVQVGDTLADGGVVSRISASEMEISHGSTRQAIHVKNVDMVFGGAP